MAREHGTLPGGSDETRKKLAIGVIAALCLVFVILLVFKKRRDSTYELVDFIVEVQAGDQAGSGFFLRSPHDPSAVYVVTARHVISNGQPVQIVHRFNGNGVRYPVVYPQVDVVATDARSDLAVLKLRDVPSEVLPALRLRDRPLIAGSRARACGFAASNQNEEGRITSNFECPEVQVQAFNQPRQLADDVTGHNLDGEPTKTVAFPVGGVTRGYSGGPLVDESRNVIGIVYELDAANNAAGAVQFDHLTSLLGRVRGFAVSASTPPTTDAIRHRMEELAGYSLRSNTLTEFAYDHVGLVDVRELRSLASQIVSTTDAFANSAAVATSSLDEFIATYERQPTSDDSSGRTDFTNLRAMDAPIRGVIYDCARGVRPRDRCVELLQRALGHELLTATMRLPSVRSGQTSAPEVPTVQGIPHLERENLYRVALSNGASIYVRSAEGRPWIALFAPDRTNVTRLAMTLGDTDRDESYFTRDFQTHAIQDLATGATVEYRGRIRRIDPRSPLLLGLSEITIRFPANPSRGCYGAPELHTSNLLMFGRVVNNRAVLHQLSAPTWVERNASSQCRRIMQESPARSSYNPKRFIVRIEETYQGFTVVPETGPLRYGTMSAWAVPSPNG